MTSNTPPAACDVVIIGGGPGGSMAATFLRQQGHDVILLEKDKHPRFHVGESLTPHFWKYTDLAGITKKIEEEGFISKTGGTSVWEGVISEMGFSDFGYDRPGMHVERDRFDQILLEHCRELGAKVFEECSVLECHLGNSDEERGVTYRRTDGGTPGGISCKYIVDASGQGAVISRQLGIRVIDPGFRFMSLWGYFRDSKYVGNGGRVHPFEDLRTIPPKTFISNVDRWGWMWHIPMREETSVGLTITLEQMKAAKAAEENLEAYFLRKCRETPYYDRLLADAHFRKGSFHVTRDYSYMPKRLAGPGYYLVGDAAAFVDPVFSIGVPLAMYSAYAAAWAIDRSLKEPSSTERNRQLYCQHYRGKLEMARSLALPFYGDSAEEAGEAVKASVKFESGAEKELMYVATALVARNVNFLGMMESEDGEKVTSDKFTVLEDILF